MAPGIGGFHIDLPALRSGTHAVRAAIQDTLRRSQPLINTDTDSAKTKTKTKTTVVWIGRASFFLNAFPVVAIIGFMLLVLSDHARRLITDITGVMTLSDGVTKADMSVRQPHLVLRSQKGFADELLPLGISLEDASGGETVSLTGLASARLSKGTSLSLAGWQVPAEDLDKTWVSAPEGFVGVMDAMVNLHSASGQLLQSKILRLEWIAKEEKEEGLPQARGTLEPVPELRPLEPPPEPAAGLGPLEPAAELRPLDAKKFAILNKIGQGLLQNGDIASARPILKSAAEAGDARAALTLGMTFDPLFMGEWRVLGAVPDVAQAYDWYDRAGKLGSAEALRHLTRLDQARRSGSGPASRSDLSRQ
jgi:hypothetical protein